MWRWCHCRGGDVVVILVVVVMWQWRHRRGGDMVVILMVVVMEGVMVVMWQLRGDGSDVDDDVVVAVELVVHYLVNHK